MKVGNIKWWKNTDTRPLQVEVIGIEETKYTGAGNYVAILLNNGDLKIIRSDDLYDSEQTALAAAIQSEKYKIRRAEQSILKFEKFLEALGS